MKWNVNGTLSRWEIWEVEILLDYKKGIVGLLEVEKKLRKRKMNTIIKYSELYSEEEIEKSLVFKQRRESVFRNVDFPKDGNKVLYGLILADGLSLSQLSKKTGLSTRVIQKTLYDNESSNESKTTLAEYFNVPSNVLFYKECFIDLKNIDFDEIEKALQALKYMKEQ